MSPDTEQRPNRQEGYERRDASIRTLLQFALWMAVILVIVIFGMRMTFNYLWRQTPAGPPATPFAQARPLPVEPSLQVHPHQDLKSYCDEQLSILNSYGYVDQQKGTVHIPIDLAMDKLLKQGLPSRPASEISPNEIIEAAKAPLWTIPTPQPTGVGGQCAFVVGPGYPEAAPTLK